MEIIHETLEPTKQIEQSYEQTTSEASQQLVSHADILEPISEGREENHPRADVHDQQKTPDAPIRTSSRGIPPPPPPRTKSAQSSPSELSAIIR